MAGASKRRAVKEMQAFSPLSHGASRLFNSPTFSDITVRFDGREIKAHKFALCTYSKWFSTAIEGSFQEATAAVIELKDDDPHSVRAMLQHMYGIDYENDDDAKKQISSSADKGMSFHAWVYITADKYDVPSLKRVALEKFEKAAIQQGRNGPVFSLVQQIYDSTHENDPLRTSAAKHVWWNLKHYESHLEEKRALRTLLEATPALGRDMMLRNLDNNCGFGGQISVRCPLCKAARFMTFGDLRSASAKCLNCGSPQDHWDDHKTTCLTA